VQAQQPETKQKCAERIPILYVPLSIVRCLGALFPSAEYHNLLHFVHKLLHPALTASKSCLLFTNRLQTVADRKKLKIQCPGVPPPFPYKLGGKIRPMLTQTPAQPIEELCQPWDLSTFPAADTRPDRFRVLFFTCAGGPDIDSDSRGYLPRRSAIE
jgi:hypothetical protein